MSVVSPSGALRPDNGSNGTLGKSLRLDVTVDVFERYEKGGKLVPGDTRFYTR